MTRTAIQLNGVAGTLADHFENKKLWFLASVSILYAAVTCLLAFYKPLWIDELNTLYISRAPTISGIWAALSTGGDQTPPLPFLITRAALALFRRDVAIRLPEVIGFWVMGICLFLFVSRRAPAVYGFLAMLFPFVTGAYEYAYEARPYGLVLGFSGLALISWQSSAGKSRRLLPLMVLTLSLAAGLSCHYYAVFVFLALAFGETVRSISRGRLDFPIWCAFAIGGTPLLGFLPLLRQAMTYSRTFWAKTAWSEIPNFYGILLGPAILPIMTLLILAAVYPLLPGLRQRVRIPYIAPPLHELAVAFGFIAMAVVAVTACMIVGAPFTYRYALPAVIGFSVVFAFGAHSLLNDRPQIAAILVFSICAFFVSLGIRVSGVLVGAREEIAQANKFLQTAPYPDLPIAVSDQHEFVTLAYYGSPDVTRRLVYLASPDASLRRLGHDSVEKGLLALSPWFPVKVERYETFIASQERFLTYGNAVHFLNWLLPELTSTDLQMELVKDNASTQLFLVSRKSEPDSNSLAGRQTPPQNTSYAH